MINCLGLRLKAFHQLTGNWTDYTLVQAYPELALV